MAVAGDSAGSRRVRVSDNTQGPFVHDIALADASVRDHPSVSK
jgi:hypothetical protein